MWLFAPFVGAFVVGIVLRYAYPDQWPIHEVVHLIGDAFAVAGVLGFVIEIFVTSRLIDHTAHSLNPQDGKVTVEVSYSFQVRNYGDTVEEYAPWLAEEDFYAPQFISLAYGIVGEPGYGWSGDELQAFVTERPDDRAKEIGGPLTTKPLPKIALRPFKQDPASVCRVAWQYVMTMPESYTDTTSFAGATIGARVVEEAVPDGFRFVGDSRYAVKSGRVWTYTRPFIPNQHIRVRWFRES
jgi:hypothetical protein